MEHGKDKFLYLRLESEQTLKDAEKLAYQVEHELNIQNSINEQVIKELTVDENGKPVGKAVTYKTAGAQAVTMSITFINSKNPTALLVEKAAKNQELLQCWEVDVTRPEEGNTGSYFTRFVQGYVGSYSIPSNPEENTSITLDLEVTGSVYEGYWALPAKDLVVLTTAGFISGNKVVSEGA